MAKAVLTYQNQGLAISASVLKVYLLKLNNLLEKFEDDKIMMINDYKAAKKLLDETIKEFEDNLDKAEKIER